MITRHRRSRLQRRNLDEDRPLQMLVGLLAYCLLGVLLGIALYDWLFDANTISSVFWGSIGQETIK